MWRRTVRKSSTMFLHGLSWRWSSTIYGSRSLLGCPLVPPLVPPLAPGWRIQTFLSQRLWDVLWGSSLVNVDVWVRSRKRRSSHLFCHFVKLLPEKFHFLLEWIALVHEPVWPLGFVGYQITWPQDHQGTTLLWEYWSGSVRLLVHLTTMFTWQQVRIRVTNPALTICSGSGRAQTSQVLAGRHKHHLIDVHLIHWEIHLSALHHPSILPPSSSIILPWSSIIINHPPSSSSSNIFHPSINVHHHPFSLHHHHHPSIIINHPSVTIHHHPWLLLMFFCIIYHSVNIFSSFVSLNFLWKVSAGTKSHQTLGSISFVTFVQTLLNCSWMTSSDELSSLFGWTFCLFVFAIYSSVTILSFLSPSSSSPRLSFSGCGLCCSSRAKCPPDGAYWTDPNSFTVPYVCPACQKLEQRELQQHEQEPQQEEERSEARLQQPSAAGPLAPAPPPHFETLIT